MSTLRGEAEDRRLPETLGARAASADRDRLPEAELEFRLTYEGQLRDLRATVANALFYPAVVLAFAIALFGFLCFFIIPQFEQIFKDFNMALPALTVLAFAIGSRPLELIVLPLVGVAGQARDALEWLTDLAVVIQLAEMVGAMKWAFDITLDWAFNRYSFGRPLA